MNSLHFRHEELTCKCGCGANNCVPELYALLDRIRERVGVTVVVTSGFRCRRHNAKVGGAKSSYHLLGRAADITCQLGVDALYQAAIRDGEIGGVGYDPHRNMLHVDVRGPFSGVVKWGYDSGGNVVSFSSIKRKVADNV